MKQFLSRFRFGLLLVLSVGLLVLGFSLGSKTSVHAKQHGLAGAPSAPEKIKLDPRSSLLRVQLEEGLMRSDATAVMFGEWLALRSSGVQRP